MTNLYTLDHLGESVRGQKVMVRVDFNVPINEGRVLDDTRLTEALPTIQELVAKGARVVLVSHRGRPKGEHRPDLSLAPVAQRFATIIGQPVSFVGDNHGAAATAAVDALEDGSVALLENLRFHPGEKANDPSFADALAKLADVYVNDAFGAAHRAHASVVGVADRMKHKAAGRLMVREVETLSRLLNAPKRPFGAVVGGAKIEGKIDTLVNLLDHLDFLVVGGGMANTFLAAQGVHLGRSLKEEGRYELAREILGRAEARGMAIHLPQDLVIVEDFDQPGINSLCRLDQVPDSGMAVDIGPKTRQQFGEVISQAKTIFWNGPMGVFERPPLDQGTLAVAHAVGSSNAFTVIGGGETVAAAKASGVEDRLDHISTGGGASLDLLAGKKLPGVTSLEIS